MLQTSEPHSPTLSPSVPQRRENVDDDLTVSISRTFDPHSELLPPQPDTIFSSADGVFFYVHRSVIREKSTNGWNGQLPHLPASTYSSDAGSSKVIALPEQAAVLNIVLHAVYGISCASYSPSIQDISAAVDAMEAYGISPKAHILPSTPLYVLILSHAPLAPLVAYTLAASHDILSLAVSISPLLLSYPLESLPEAAVQSMGAVYLKRLLLLHNDRLAAFRRLLPPSPLPHLPTASCQSAEHSSLSRAWTIAAAHLAWEASPGTHRRCICIFARSNWAASRQISPRARSRPSSRPC